MSATPHADIPSVDPRPVHFVDAYGLEALWIGSQYQAGTRVVMLVTSAGHDSFESAVAFGAFMEGSILILAVDPARGAVEASACIVACYRWLLAQLVVPDDVVIVAQDDLGGLIPHLTERLRNSGDASPGGITVMDRVCRAFARPAVGSTGA